MARSATTPSPISAATPPPQASRSTAAPTPRLSPIRRPLPSIGGAGNGGWTPGPCGGAGAGAVMNPDYDSAPRFGGPDSAPRFGGPVAGPQLDRTAGWRARHGLERGRFVHRAGEQRGGVHLDVEPAQGTPVGSHGFPVGRERPAAGVLQGAGEPA